ncbi:APC family permease [Paraburkholderia sp. SIMBA_049]
MLADSTQEEAQALRGTLTTKQTALLVIAAAAPLGAIVGTLPVALMLGNGAGVAGTFLIAGLLMICFGIAYSALIRAIPGAGAFYRYLSSVFGSRVGNGAAWVALASYLALATALATTCGYFTDLSLSTIGIHVGWKACAVFFMALVAILGRSNVDIAAKVLVPLVLAEFGILLILALATLQHKGLGAFPIEAVQPNHVFTKGFGVSLMIGLASFIGIESAALYALEARNPGETIPRATVIAIVMVAIAYFASVWTIVGDLGWTAVQALATKQQGDLVINSFRSNTGELMTGLVSLMICTSNFACYLALHNAATRYVFTLSNEGSLPAFFANAHSRHGSPANASTAVSVLILVFIAVPTAIGVDPYVTILPSAIALGTIGIIALQSAVSLSTIVHFARTRDARFWVTRIAPVISTIGFFAAAWLITSNYGLFTGSESALVNSLPFVLLFVFIYGLVFKRGARKGEV